jgi:hypothetical protein
VKERSITIPCTPADGPDRVSPIMVFIGVDKTGADRTMYECPYCHGLGPRRKPIAKHMGMIADQAATCKVLLKQDADRWASKNISFPGT